MGQKLTLEELEQTNGGGKLSAIGVAVIVGGFISFVTGLINGYQRPLTCGSSK